MILNDNFFDRDVVEVARNLIGIELLVDGVGGLIIETEAYRADDPAAHSFGGQTIRNKSMFGLPATVYVYRSYGLHWCLNFVCRSGSAVLIRALEPQQGIRSMELRRNTNHQKLLCSGPGRLTQALAIDARLDGTNVLLLPFQLCRRETPDIVSGPRIGISKAIDYPWRFGKLGSAFWSRRF